MDLQGDKNQSQGKRSWVDKLKGFFGAKDREANQKDKDVLVDYNKVFQQEKDKRKQEQDALLYRKTPPKKYPKPGSGQTKAQDTEEEEAEDEEKASPDQTLSKNRPQNRNTGKQDQAAQPRSQAPDKPANAQPSGQANQTEPSARTKADKERGTGEKQTNKKGPKFDPKGMWNWMNKKIREYKRRKLDSSDTLKTNLIEGTDEITFDWKGVLKVFAVNLVIAFFVVGSLYGVVAYWEGRTDKRSESLEEEIQRLRDVIASKEEKVAQSEDLQRKTEIVATLLDRHVYWTQFFKFLEERTLPEVYFTEGFSGDPKGEYSLSAQTDNFASISEQVAVLQDHEMVKDASVQSGSLKVKSVEVEGQAGGEGGNDRETPQKKEKEIVTFTLNLRLDPAIFHKQPSKDE